MPLPLSVWLVLSALLLSFIPFFVLTGLVLIANELSTIRKTLPEYEKDLKEAKKRFDKLSKQYKSAGVLIKQR